MSNMYTATIYAENLTVAQKSGDDIEALYAWMLVYNNGDSYRDTRVNCHFHGEIIDNVTKEIVRKFKKSTIE